MRGLPEVDGEATMPGGRHIMEFIVDASASSAATWQKSLRCTKCTLLRVFIDLNQVGP